MPATSEGKLFGETLKRLREQRGLSQEKLANDPRLGSAAMTSSYISDLERGIKSPGLLVILKLSLALNCSPADLLADFSPAVIRRFIK